jgi:hypothetical protein
VPASRDRCRLGVKADDTLGHLNQSRFRVCLSCMMTLTQHSPKETLKNHENLRTAGSLAKF